MLLEDGRIRIDHINCRFAARESTDYEKGGYTDCFRPPGKMTPSATATRPHQAPRRVRRPPALAGPNAGPFVRAPASVRGALRTLALS